MNPKDKKVLIVDDISDNINIISNILTYEGYQINFCFDGESAIKYLSENSCDLILLDVMMPKMSGFEVFKSIKKNNLTKDIPIIFLTANSDQDIIEEAFSIGAVDYITKPFHIKEFKSRVRNHLLLSDREKKLEISNSTKDKLFSIIAHDIKNSISIFESLFMIILDTFDDLSKEELFKYLSEGKNQVRSITVLLDNLLSWARLQKDKITINKEKLNLNDLIKEVLSLFDEQLNKKNIIISLNLFDDIIIFSDKMILQTILRNLLSNAIKYSNLDGTIELTTFISDNGKINISITDHGTGMDQETIVKIFSSDINITSIKGTDSEKGTGLGLLVIKEFIQILDAKLTCTSNIGSGTKFTIII